VEELLGLSAEDLEAIGRGRPQRAEAAPSPAEQNVLQDRYDGRLFGELYEASREIRSLAESEGAPETFRALLRDFFCAFYKSGPTLAPEEDVEERHRRLNRPLVERLLEDEKTRVARLWTRLDPLSSGLASLAAGRRVLKEITEKPEPEGPSRRAQENPPPAQQQQQQQGPGKEAPPGEGAGTGGPPEKPVDEGAQDEDELKRTARAAAGEALEEAENLHEALSCWGLSPADLLKAPPGERFELARRLGGKDLRRLTDLVGRMRRLAAAKRRQKENERREEVHSVTLGGDPARILPAELAAGLASRNPLRRRDFYRRLAEGQILSHELRAEELSGRGPMVTLIDASGSMSGQKMEWAVAVALALVDEAAGRRRRGAPKRRASVLFFNSQLVREVAFEPGERDARKLLEVAAVGAGGGTDYRPALARAVEIAGGSGHEGADLLLVTDALFRLPEGSVEELEGHKGRLGFRLYSVLIGADRRRAGEELGRYSEEVWVAADLAADGDEVAGSVFGRVS
jgi:Mg-chelatase subunit ChlD